MDARLSGAKQSTHSEQAFCSWLICASIETHVQARINSLFCGWRTPFLRRYLRGLAGGSTQLASTPSCQPQPRRHSRRRTAGSTQLTPTPSCQPMQRESKEGTLWHCNVNIDYANSAVVFATRAQSSRQRSGIKTPGQLLDIANKGSPLQLACCIQTKGDQAGQAVDGQGDEDDSKRYADNHSGIF